MQASPELVGVICGPFSSTAPANQFPTMNGLCIFLEAGAFDTLITIIPIALLVRLLKRTIAFVYPLRRSMKSWTGDPSAALDFVS